MFLYLFFVLFLDCFNTLKFTNLKLKTISYLQINKQFCLMCFLQCLQCPVNSIKFSVIHFRSARKHNILALTCSSNETFNRT